MLKKFTLVPLLTCIMLTGCVQSTGQTMNAASPSAIAAPLENSSVQTTQQTATTTSVPNNSVLPTTVPIIETKVTQSQQLFKDSDTGFSIEYPQYYKLEKTYGKNIPKLAPNSDIISGIQISNGTNTNVVVIVQDKKGITDPVVWYNKYAPGRSSNISRMNYTFKEYIAYKHQFEKGQTIEENITFLTDKYAYFIGRTYTNDIDDKETQKIMDSIDGI